MNILRCEVAFRVMTLAAWAFLAMLISGCPGGKKDNAMQRACARISNTVMYGNECTCRQGYTKMAYSGVGELDFQCQLAQRCLGNSRQQHDGSCQCNNGRIYNTNNLQSPCGDNLGGGTRLGMDMQQLQTACNGIGTWNNGFCACPQGQQFNAATRRCEPLMWHHTQTMCGTGATFYGHGGRGVCVCQNSQALFHPAFGGCNTHVGTEVIGHMCSGLYGVTAGPQMHTAQQMQGHCACPSGRVWFRGSCLDLGHDFITQVPNLPEAVRCELQGKRLVDGTRCETYGGFGAFGYGNGPIRPIVCVRNALVGNASKERVELHPDGRVHVEITRFGREFGYTYPSPQEYFRIRCEQYALAPEGYWTSEQIGTYRPLDPPYFGECKCGDPRGNIRYTTEYDRHLGYSFCAAVGAPLHHTECRWASLCEGGLNISVDPTGEVSGDVSICTRGGRRVSIDLR